MNVREFDDSYTFIFAGDVIQVCASFSSKMITNKIHSTTIFHTLTPTLPAVIVCGTAFPTDEDGHTFMIDVNSYFQFCSQGVYCTPLTIPISA